MILPPQSDPSSWPHRAAVALACATFPLIWVGGLVTTYDAGMAVPDWPDTYGHNMFLYPWTTWLAGTFDVFIEHGHRLLGALVGLLALALAAVAWRTDRSRGLRMATLIAVAAVILQGVLGGLRVRLNERWLAQLHGCCGPAFFAYVCGLAVATSGRWRQMQTSLHPRGAQVRRMALATLLLAYLQIVLGSFLRHAAPDLPADQFRLAVWLHVGVAVALVAHAAWLARLGLAVRRAAPAVARPAWNLVTLVGLQLALGGGVWLANFGWPAALPGPAWAQAYVVLKSGFWQAAVTTAHVAVGSLILATATITYLRATRHLSAEPVARPAGPVGTEGWGKAVLA